MTPEQMLAELNSGNLSSIVDWGILSRDDDGKLTFERSNSEGDARKTHRMFYKGVESCVVSRAGGWLAS